MYFTGIYLTISMAVTSISVILTVCVLKLHHCGPHQLPVPGWMKCLVLGFLASLVRCQCTPSKKHSNKYKGDNGLTSRENSEVCLRLMSEINTRGGGSSPINMYRHGNSSSTQPVVANHVECNNVHENRQYSPSSKNHHRHQETTVNTNLSVPTTNAQGQFNNQQQYQIELQRLNVLEDILKQLKIMVSKRDEDDRETDIVNEWQQVAQVMDRFLFWFFLSVTGLATLVIMVIIPLVRYIEEG